MTQFSSLSEDSNEKPKVSIVIPVYNEEGILHSSVIDLIERLEAFPFVYEILLAENGSRAQSNSSLATTKTPSPPESAAKNSIGSGSFPARRSLSSSARRAPGLPRRSANPMGRVQRKG